MRTFDQMHDDCHAAGHPCSYWGDHGDWLCVLGRSRDSGILDNSNFEVARKMLEAIDSDCCVVESESHWAVGWVETLLVDPTHAVAIACAEDILQRIDDYPILDEDDYSEREWTVYEESWDSWGRDEFRATLVVQLHDYPACQSVINAVDDSIIEELWESVRDALNWEYEPAGSGCVSINIDGAVKKVLDRRLLLPILWANRPKHQFTLAPPAPKFCEGQGILFDV